MLHWRGSRTLRFVFARRCATSKLFISYRRDDTADICGRIYDQLAPHFGQENVFKDVDSIPLGADFRAILRDAVGQCAAMLVVIGRHWAEARDAQGQRRLEQPNDFVRIEVEAALGRSIPVIPVLVQGAGMPHQRELPASLAELAYRHAFEVRSDPHFHRDMAQFVERLAPLLQPAQRPVSQAPTVHSAAPPPTTPVIPPERFPARLDELGFEPRTLGGVEAILPPLCAVPAGEFLMGSDPRQDSRAFGDERPQHRLTLPAFQIARFPVTVAEYACFVRAGQSAPKPWENGGKVMDWQAQLARLDHPVVRVSWRDGVAYAGWLAKLTGQPWRLPTEAEWEKAARWDPAQRQARIYPWGDAFDQARCNTYESGIGTTTPVGTYPSGASPCGAQDLAGNVWDWTSSLFKPYPYTPNDGREREDSTDNRVLRGGSWSYFARNARAACRNDSDPDLVLVYIGFRLVLAVPGSS